MSGSRNIKQMVRNISAGVIQISNDKITESDPVASEFTPLSPSSNFTESKVDIPGQNFVRFIVLSHWDNILGPRVIHAWNYDGESPLDVQLLSRISSQTLSGEICREVNNVIDHKFYEIPNVEMIVNAFVFSAKGLGGPSVHGLSVVMQRSDLSFFLSTNHLFLKCFERVVSKLKIIMDQVSQESVPNVPFEDFGILSQSCVKTLSSLKQSKFPQKVKLFETYLCPAHHLDRDFLCSCISSHLCTFGRSYVIGDRHDGINMMLKTLSLFNTVKERFCSMLVDQSTQQAYHHDMWLQGCKVTDQLDFPVHDILYSEYPTTVIDLNQRVVKESPPYVNHVTYSRDQRYNELIGLMYDDNEPSIPRGELFTLHDHSSTLIPGLLDELDKLPAECGIREAYIVQFNRALQKKALCIIKYVEGETNFGATQFRSGMRKLQKDLCIVSEGDLRIYIATAEKLKPGLCWFLHGGSTNRNSQADL